MKFDELSIGDKILIRHSGNDVTYSSIQEMKVLSFSAESKAIKFHIVDKFDSAGRFEWKSVEDLNSKYEIFDFVTTM